MLLSGVMGCVLLFAPLYTGLIARDLVTSRPTLVSTTPVLQSMQQYVQGKLSESISVNFITEAVNASGRGVATRMAIYESFFVLIAHAVAYMREASPVMFFLTVCAFFAATISTLLTTVDSFVMSIAQTMFRYVERRQFGAAKPWPAKLVWILANPASTLGIFSIIIAIALYIGWTLPTAFTGPLAWSITAFLGSAAFVTVLLREVVWFRRHMVGVLRGIWAGFIGWLVVFVLPAGAIALADSKAFATFLTPLPVWMRAVVGAVGTLPLMPVWGLLSILVAVTLMQWKGGDVQSAAAVEEETSHE